jgi:phosphate acetyltransferase
MDTLDYCSNTGDLARLSLAEAAPAAPDMIVNRTFEELVIGDFAQIVRTLTQDDIELFANVSGDVNPAYLDPVYADGTRFHGVIAHGMLGGSLFSTVLGTMLPGAGTVYLSQDLHFRRPVKPGDTLTARVVVREMHAATNRVVLDCVLH